MCARGARVELRLGIKPGKQRANCTSFVTLCGSNYLVITPEPATFLGPSRTHASRDNYTNTRTTGRTTTPSSALAECDLLDRFNPTARCATRVSLSFLKVGALLPQDHTWWVGSDFTRLNSSYPAVNLKPQPEPATSARSWVVKFS